MPVLKSEKRNEQLNGKQLRKNGIIPAILYGKNLEAPVKLQISESDAMQFLKKNSAGAQVELTVDGEKQLAMLKDVSRTVLSNNIEHIDFQALTAGEKVKVSAHINFLNGEKAPADALVSEYLQEIEYESLPQYLVDHIDVDLAGLQIGDSIQVKDLDMFKDDNYNVITPEDSTIVVLSLAKEESVESDENADAEVPVIGADEE